MNDLSLDQVVRGLYPSRLLGELPQRLADLTEDSREVQEGGGFIALKGFLSDGHRFIGAAIDLGATVIFCEEIPAEFEESQFEESQFEKGQPEESQRVCFVELPKLRAQRPQLSQAVYGIPWLKLKVFAVTGTNGKTTTTHIIESIGAALGYKVGVIGTISHRYPGFELVAQNTTPSVLMMDRLGAQMLRDGVEWVALEASSHGLELGRMANVLVDAAAWTHLGQDHLDFHHTERAYRDAKLSLFDEVLPRSQAAGKTPCALINAEDPAAREDFLTPQRQGALGNALRWFGATDPEDISSPPLTLNLYAHNLQTDEFGTRGKIDFKGETFDFALPLNGHFNLLNALTALSAVLSVGTPPQRAIDALKTLPQIPGRMERVNAPGEPRVIVDYAHTPDALVCLLEALRDSTSGRLIVIFGAGGDRDHDKRPLMGSAASVLADRLIITNDNPRSEDPQSIADDILLGIPPGLLSDAEVCLDRPQAITTAILQANPEDTVVIAGKGHETHQTIAGERFVMDDRVLAKFALQQRTQDPSTQDPSAVGGKGPA